jgi:hypothetical protein
MNYYRCISFRKEGLSPSVLREVVDCYPKFGEGSGFRHTAYLEVQPSDENGAKLADQLLALFEKLGISSSRGWVPGTYFHEVNRHYDEDDYRSAEFLLLLRQHEIQREHERDPQGRLLLIASKARPSIKLGRIWANWIIVSNKVRKLLETQDFKGLEFGEVVLKGKSIHAAKEPFWELKSSITLPVMANKDQFIHPGMDAPEPFQGNFSNIIMLHDPPYRTGEVHYRKTELAPMLPFDVARTFENFIEPHPALIVSQRLYQFCLKHKIPLNVQPVRIDPS